MRSTKAFVIGVGSAYLFDPRSGRRRRRIVRDRSLHFVRRVGKAANRRQRYVRGRLRGVQATVRRHDRSDRSTDDHTISQRIKSEALREAGVSARDVEVEVQDGVVTLRGRVEDDAIANTLVQSVSGVQGVSDVAAMLHVTQGTDGFG